MDKQDINNIEIPKKIEETSNEQKIEQPVSSNSGIELPDVVMPVEEKRIPTLEEIEAQKKAEEDQITSQKKLNHDKNFNRNEEVIYTVKEEKEGNPLFILFVFGFIALFVLFLPLINTSLRKFLGIDYKFFQNQWSSTGQATTVTTEDPQTKYTFKDPSTRVNIGDLALTNFVTTKKNDQEYEIDFTIINEGDESYIYDKKYYIVLYDDDVLIYRALIHSYTPLASKAASELSLPITYTAYKKATSFEVTEISETQYPEIEFVNKSDNYDMLSCTYNNDTMEYYFENDKLIKINEKYYEDAESSTSYQTDLETYKENYEKYKEITGFDSTFVETTVDFTMYATGNLSEVQDITMNNLKVYKFFKYSTNSKTVAFEMSAMAYTCDNTTKE